MIVPALLLSVPSFFGGPTLHSVSAWRADLEHLVTRVRAGHPAPFLFGATQEQFLAAVGELERTIPELDDGRIVLELFRVLALLDDSHSEPFWNSIPDDLIDMRVGPLRFYHLEGGVFVTATSPSEVEWLGARLTHIDGRPAHDVLSTAMQFMSGDNWIRRRTVAVEVALTRPGVLHALGLCDGPDHYALTLEVESGGERTVEFTILDGPSFPPVLQNEAMVQQTPTTVWSRQVWEPLADPSTLPLWRQDRGRRYWFELLPDGRTLYMRFKRVVDDPAESFDAFTERLFAFAGEHEVERLVIDMRTNRGGYGRFGLSFVERLAEHDLGRRGNLFVLLGRGTKSAAPFFAQRLALAAEPLFVGEPSGGRPTPVGNTFRIELPNSKVAVRCGGKLFELGDEPDLGPTIRPDLPVEATLASLRSNADPVLAAALAHGR